MGGKTKKTKLTPEEEEMFNKKRSKHADRKFKLRQKVAKVDGPLEEQFLAGRVLAAISSRPGQVGRSDGYILEGKELEFYLKKIKAKKGK
jgi:small subunit ribosomal protein S8e